MRYTRLSASFIVLCNFILTTESKLSGRQDSFEEELLISPLDDGKLLAHFQFTTLVELDSAVEKKGKPIGQVINHHDVQELHLTFTQGRWQYEEWGYPVSQSAGTGVELWAWMKGDTTIETNWRSLTNTLSGLFCASLNFIDDTLTSQPELSFRPEGHNNSYYHNRHMNEGVELRYGHLPHENVCTENLTPWLKLLPCKSKTGIAALLNAHKLYDTNYHSMAIHILPICQDEACTVQRLKLVQTVTSVLDPVRDTGRRDWSLSSLFDRDIPSSCPVSERSSVIVQLPLQEQSFELSPKYEVITDTKHHNQKKIAYYDLKKGELMTKCLNEMISSSDIKHVFLETEPLNLKMTWHEDTFSYPAESLKPGIVAHKYLTGYGHERGGVTVNIFNQLNGSQEVDYFDSVPWYLKLYLHTLKVTVLGNDNISQNDIVKDMYYQPAIDRSRPQVLEMKMLLPPNSVTAVSIEFDKVFLKYTEHRPDANRGFDVGPAVISAAFPDDTSHMATNDFDTISKHTDIKALKQIKVYTEIMLASLPTPDFSMPYNVITLTCTVIALFFGSLFKLLIQKFEVVEDEDQNQQLKKTTQS
ncbi:Subunit of the glycosylphosphatidylinositol transamidase complex-like protein [Umbelopsis sp. WA50703]